MRLSRATSAAALSAVLLATACSAGAGPDEPGATDPGPATGSQIGRAHV